MFKNNFQDTLNPLCTCGCNNENKYHFLLHCLNFLAERNTLLYKIANIDSNILNQADNTTSKTLLFGNSKYSNEVNLQILNASINFILIFKGFDEPLKFLIIKINNCLFISIAHKNYLPI